MCLPLTLLLLLLLFLFSSFLLFFLYNLYPRYEGFHLLFQITPPWATCVLYLKTFTVTGADPENSIGSWFYAARPAAPPLWFPSRRH